MHPPPAGGHSSGSSSLRRVQACLYYLLRCSAALAAAPVSCRCSAHATRSCALSCLQAFRATNLGLERRLTPSNVDAKEPRLLISYNVWWQWLDGLQHVADELKSGAATPMLLRLRHEESGASWDVPLKPRVKDGMQLEPSTLAVLLGALGARAGHHLVFELVASECSSAALAAKVRLVERPCGRPPVPHSAPVDLPGRALPRLMPPLQNAVCQQRYEEAVMCKGSGSEAVQAVPENEGADTEAGAPRRNQRRYAQQAQAEAWTRCDNIIQELYSMSGGAVQQEFGHPVDPERFPAYRIIVKRPMDLGSIEARLPTAWGRPDAYDSPLQFRDDVRLVFDNCRLYSVPGTTLRKLGEAASAKFEKLWAAEEVERFWQQGQQPEGAAAAPTAAGVQPAAQPPEQQTAAPAPTEQQGQQPPPAPQQQQPPQASEPTPPPDAHSYHGQHWEHRSPYASSAPRGPTPVSFAKKTLQKLFGWQHGSDKNIRPTAVLRYVPAGSTQSVEAEVQLLPPGRDDAEVQARKEEGGARPKVDGYRLPTEALRALYQGLAAPEGARLRFTSAGWRGTQLVFDVSLLPADGADATAASMGGSMPAADSEPQVAERTGPAHDAAAAAAAQVQAPTSGAAPAAAATQAAAAPAAAGSAAAAGAQPEAAAGAGPTPEPAAAPAATPAAPQGDALLDGLAAAAEAASSGHQPLAAIAGSFDAAAQAIIQRGREGWLSTESVYDLLVHGQEWGIEPAVIAPVRPAAGDLFLVDGRKQLERRDGHNWVDRCSAKLRLKGREAVQVVYHTTADRSLQRRWFYLLDDPSSHAHLLHYQLPEPKLTGRRQRGSRRKSDWAEVGEPEAVAAKRSRQPAQGGESLQGANAAAAADASAHPLPAAECRQTARPHADTANDLQRALSSALQAARPAAQQQQCVQQGMTALETAGDDPAAWHAALELLVQGGVGGKVLQDAVVGWDALTPQQHCGVHVVVLRAAVEGGWAQLEARLREVLAQAPLAEGASAAAVAPAGVPAQPSAGLVAAFQAAQQQRSQPVEPPKPPQPPPQGSLSPAPAAASAAPSGGAADPATRAAQLADESSGTNRLAVFQALQRILRRAGVAGGDMQAFLKRHVMDNPDGEQRAMHWSILSEHDREREDDLICAWVQQNL